jgi:hypothetical protein
LVLLPVGAVAACVFDPDNPMNHPAAIPIFFAVSLWVIWSSHRHAKLIDEHREWVEAIKRNMRETEEASERRCRQYQQDAERFRRQRQAQQDHQA